MKAMMNLFGLLQFSANRLNVYGLGVHGTFFYDVVVGCSWGSSMTNYSILSEFNWLSNCILIGCFYVMFSAWFKVSNKRSLIISKSAQIINSNAFGNKRKVAIEIGAAEDCKVFWWRNDETPGTINQHWKLEVTDGRFHHISLI